jgi:hypothetical protein
MTATETMAAPTTTDTWTAEMAQLRNRYKAVREPILAALNLLHQDPNITDDDAKARAAMRGVRITAASINGARNLLLKAGDVQTITATPTTPATPRSAAAAPQRAARRARPAESSVDAEALIRQVVGKLQSQGNAEAERLRDGIKKAMAALQALVA